MEPDDPGRSCRHLGRLCRHYQAESERQRRHPEGVSGQGGV